MVRGWEWLGDKETRAWPMGSGKEGQQEGGATGLTQEGPLVPRLDPPLQGSTCLLTPSSHPSGGWGCVAYVTWTQLPTRCSTPSLAPLVCVCVCLEQTVHFVQIY